MTLRLRRQRDEGGLDVVDVLRVRTGLVLLAASGDDSYLRKEARAHRTDVAGLLDAATEAAPDDERLRQLIDSSPSGVA